MIKYVAFMKFRDDTPADKLKEIEAHLKVLGKTMGEVAKWSCGRFLGSFGGATGWTFIIVADFKDAQAFERYRAHPQHQAFGELGKPYREKSVGMCYEAHYPYMGLTRLEGGVPVLIPMHRLPPLEAQTPA